MVQKKNNLKIKKRSTSLTTYYYLIKVISIFTFLSNSYSHSKKPTPVLTEGNKNFVAVNSQTQISTITNMITK